MATSDKPLLIVAAVRQELGPFLRRRPTNVEILFTGMGQAAALEKVKKKLARGGWDGVVSTGFAGGIRPGLALGDLLMASEVVDASSGKRWRPEGHFPRSNGNPFRMGRFVTVDTLCPTPEAKAVLGFRFGADCVEMETAAVVQAAQEAGVPWRALRVILDPLEKTVPVGSGWDALKFLARPSQWGEFNRFLQEIQTASDILAQGLGSFT